MKKLVDPVLAEYAKEIEADGHSGADQRHPVAAPTWIRRPGQRSRPPFAQRLRGTMTPAISARRSGWRKLTACYAAFLSWCSSLSTAILVIPVTLQIFSRFTAIIPHYIWTEEMARFLLVWTVMIGAMIGVRESTHFEVDVWPRLSQARRSGAPADRPARHPRRRAGLRLVRHRVHPLRLVPDLGTGRAAALAHPYRLADHRRDLAHLPRRADVGRVQRPDRADRVTRQPDPNRSHAVGGNSRDRRAVHARPRRRSSCSACSSGCCSCACPWPSRWRSPACRCWCWSPGSRP